jgi:hypothetical protein
MKLYTAAIGYKSDSKPYNLLNKSQTKYLWQSYNSYGCVNYAELTLQISSVNINSQSFTTCDTDVSQDGLSFWFKSQVTPQVLSGLPVGLVVEYYLNSNDAVSQNNVFQMCIQNTTPNQQTIFARIVNSPDCYWHSILHSLWRRLTSNFRCKQSSM